MKCEQKEELKTRNQKQKNRSPARNTIYIWLAQRVVSRATIAIIVQRPWLESTNAAHCCSSTGLGTISHSLLLPTATAILSVTA